MWLYSHQGHVTTAEICPSEQDSVTGLVKGKTIDLNLICLEVLFVFNL
jgi:hypothetical protein